MQRIKELEKLATEVERSHGAFNESEKYYRLNVEKFAELLIKDCIDIVNLHDNRSSDEWDKCARSISLDISLMFGVK